MREINKSHLPNLTVILLFIMLITYSIDSYKLV